MTRIEINVLISLKHSLQITAQMKKNPVIPNLLRSYRLAYIFNEFFGNYISNCLEIWILSVPSQIITFIKTTP